MEVGVKEVRNNLSDLLKRVEAGEQVIITRRGHPIARIIPEPSDLPPLNLGEFRKSVSDDGGSLLKTVLKERQEAHY